MFMEYAVVRTGGKQYKVSKGEIIEVERLNVAPGEKLSFEDVLLHVGDKVAKLGKPKLKGIVVKATVLDHLKGKKLRISKFKAKSKYRRVTGHRQKLSRVKIEEIAKI